MHTNFPCFAGGAASVLCEKSHADQPRDRRRVGVLFRGMPSPKLTDHFPKSLGELGWFDGENIFIEERYGGGEQARLFELAKELVSIRTNVIVANSSPAARAAMAATKTVPIVAIGEPVSDNLVTNWVRPETNVTGLSLERVAGNQRQATRNA